MFPKSGVKFGSRRGAGWCFLNHLFLAPSPPTFPQGTGQDLGRGVENMSGGGAVASGRARCPGGSGGGSGCPGGPRRPGVRGRGAERLPVTGEGDCPRPCSDTAGYPSHSCPSAGRTGAAAPGLSTHGLGARVGADFRAPRGRGAETGTHGLGARVGDVVAEAPHTRCVCAGVGAEQPRVWGQ